MLFLALSPFGLPAQEEVMMGGMKFSYQLLDEEIEVTLEAPTLGWVGVGFNDHNSIVKSDLLLFHVVEGQVEGLDMHVVAAGNPQEDEDLGGTMDISAPEGKEEKGKTHIKFRLPFPAKDAFDFTHRLNRQFWLILAYSTHDDFGHHSAMRKHRLVTLANKP